MVRANVKTVMRCCLQDLVNQEDTEQAYTLCESEMLCSMLNDANAIRQTASLAPWGGHLVLLKKQQQHDVIIRYGKTQYKKRQNEEFVLCVLVVNSNCSIVTSYELV